MKNLRLIKMLMAATLAGTVLLSLPHAETALAKTGDTLYTKTLQNGDASVSQQKAAAPYYSAYLSKYAGRDYTGSKIALDMARTKTSAGGTARLQTLLGRKCLLWKPDSFKWAEWTVSVPTDGCYNLEVSYLTVTGSGATPQREVDLDGSLPFEEAASVAFPLQWVSDGGVWINSLGDQVRPEQKQVNEWQTIRLEDSEGLYEQPLRFYMTAGTHTVRLAFSDETLAISNVALAAPETYKSYAEVSKEYTASGYRPAQQSVKVQGEAAVSVSQSSVRIQSDGDPSVQPASTWNVVYNTIGGGSWNKADESVTWKVSAPQDGLYKLAFRVYQDYTDGLPVFRQIEVDGSVPFKEFLCVEFPYSKWTYRDIGDAKGKPYEIYLTKGTHTLTLTSKICPYAEIIHQLEEQSDNLSNQIQRVIRITGITPDVNYDYQLNTKLPDLVPNFKKISAALQNLTDQITKIADKRPGSINNLLMIKSQLDAMIRNPFLIGRGLQDLMDGQSTMASWISDFQSSPLQVDYFKLASIGEKTQDYSSNFLQKLTAVCQTFASSFVKDYNSVGRNASGKKGKTLHVWIARAKEWAEDLQYLTDEEFTKRTGINVQMNVVPTSSLTGNGVLLVAVASGNAPDIAMGVTSTIPFDYGVRGAVCDLSGFPDYQEVAKRFLPGIMIPYESDGKVYAIPETMDFSVLFYRKDIMSELGLQIPQTWEELYSKILPTLKKNGMDFYYDGGYQTFLYQNGGSYYSADGKKSALDTPQAYAAFKQYTDLYTIYDIPVSANFYSRFRSGQIPIGINSFNSYIQIATTAPELNGKWDVAMIPGIRQSNGEINRSYGGVSTASMITTSSKLKQESWAYLKWFTSTDTQVRYANDIVATVGQEARWCSANEQAFEQFPWESNLKSVIESQKKWYKDMPNVIGGYITQRYIENARVRTVIEGQQYRESLEESVEDIDRELTYKNQEFALHDSQ